MAVLAHGVVVEGAAGGLEAIGARAIRGDLVAGSAERVEVAVLEEHVVGEQVEVLDGGARALVVVNGVDPATGRRDPVPGAHVHAGGAVEGDRPGFRDVKRFEDRPVVAVDLEDLVAAVVREVKPRPVEAELQGAIDDARVVLDPGTGGVVDVEAVLARVGALVRDPDVAIGRIDPDVPGAAELGSVGLIQEAEGLVGGQAASRARLEPDDGALRDVRDVEPILVG
ncbi:hypothetical protein D3C86_714380 [compost metagenome]